MGKAVNTCADNLGYFNPPNVYRPAIIDIRIVGEYSAEDGATNTYRITQNDGKIFEFDVKNGSGGSTGRSVTFVEQIQISTESLGKNIARITLSDGTYTDVEIRNGAQGGPGPQGERGPAGIDSVEAAIGTNDPTQAPSVDKDLTEGVLSLTFNNIKGQKGDKGDQGNTGSSVDYPYELVNNVTTDDATKGLSAAQGVVLDGKISQLGQQVIYDVTKNNPTAGPNNDGKFESLSALLLDANLSTLIPITVRCGGMSIRFVQSSDNKYVQYRLMSDTFNTTIANWQGVDDSITIESNNLAKSKGVAHYLPKAINENESPEYTIGNVNSTGEVNTGATQYGFSAPILLQAGATIFLNNGNDVYQGNNVAVVYKTLQDGTFVEPIIIGSSVTGKVIYSNRTDTDIYVGICTYITALPYRIEKLLVAAAKQDLNDKLSLTSIDGLSVGEVVDNKLVKFDDGSIVGSGNFKYYIYNVKLLSLRKVYAVLADNSDVAAIAFFRGEISSSGYIKLSSVKAKRADYYEYSADVPSDADYVVVTNKKATLSEPTIILYTLPNVVTISDFNDYNKLSLYKREKSATSSEFSGTANLASYNLKEGEQIELDVTDFSGDSIAFIRVNGSDYEIPGTGKYYFDITKQFDGTVYFQKFAATNNIFNFTISRTKTYVICNRLTPSYILTDKNSVEIGTPISGVYNPTTKEFAYSGQWCTFPTQYSNGYKIRINCTDFSIYYVRLEIVGSNGRFEHMQITEATEVGIYNCYGWRIAIRRIDYGQIVPSDVFDKVSVQFVEGQIFESPLLKNDGDKIENVARSANHINPFANTPYYYHFNPIGFVLDDNGRKAIPAESLFDVEFAARLGFKFVEANIHKTSDNAFVCLHSENGAFGAMFKSADETAVSTSSLRSTLIKNVTLQWIRDYVRYDSDYEKYQVTVPTLEEFCIACKVNSIGIFAGVGIAGQEAVDVCIHYLGDNVIFYNPTRSVALYLRNYFHGYVYLWITSTSETVDSIISRISIYQSPVIIGLSPDLINSLNGRSAGENLDTLITEIHNKGNLIAWAAVYSTEDKGLEYIRRGFDFAGSGHEVNDFVHNYEVFDLESGILNTTGTINYDVISLDTNDTITCGSDVLVVGKAYLKIKFSGSLNIHFGSLGSRTFTSNGKDIVVLSDYLYKMPSTLEIEAMENTVVTFFEYKTSKC